MPVFTALTQASFRFLTNKEDETNGLWFIKDGSLHAGVMCAVDATIKPLNSNQPLHFQYFTTMC